ncbi:hypothetical protein U1Q18_016263 [Sarracenia purpurea var. burkii]
MKYALMATWGNHACNNQRGNQVRQVPEDSYLVRRGRTPERKIQLRSEIHRGRVDRAKDYSPDRSSNRIPLRRNLSLGCPTIQRVVD